MSHVVLLKFGVKCSASVGGGRESGRDGVGGRVRGSGRVKGREGGRN